VPHELTVNESNETSAVAATPLAGADEDDDEEVVVDDEDDAGREYIISGCKQDVSIHKMLPFTFKET